MRNSIKKISLYLLIASLSWLPVQVTFAASFTMPAKMVMHSDLDSSALHLSVATQGDQQLEKSSPCHTPNQKKNCCSEDGACSQMDQGCNHCVSFVAMAHEVQQQLFSQYYTIEYNYNHRLTGITSLSAYRPPC